MSRSMGASVLVSASGKVAAMTITMMGPARYRNKSNSNRITVYVVAAAAYAVSNSLLGGIGCTPCLIRRPPSRRSL